MRLGFSFNLLCGCILIELNQVNGKKSIFPSFYVKEHVAMYSWTTADKKSNQELEHHLKSLTTDKYRACEGIINIAIVLRNSNKKKVN